MPPVLQARNLVLVVALMSAAGCGASGSPPTSTGQVSKQIATPVPSAPVPSATTARRPAKAPAGRKPVRKSPATRVTPRHGSQSPPGVVWDQIPFGPRRRAETAAYAARHYGSFMQPTWRLIDPRVIVIHYTDSGFGSAFSTFAADVPDVELHELPGTCAHFLIDTDGTIHQLVPLNTICRHTVGLNWTAIGIEHVGFSDPEVLGNRRELSASLRLVRWLQCRFHIQTQNVIGHNESLSSPFHREDVAALRDQTHGDFNRADMQIYRARLRPGGCP